MAMDLITSPTATATATTIRARTPDSDTETPPPQPLLKRAHHTHAPPLTVVVSYKECMKNHAANIGGHALDGCCEFMPGPTATPSDPTSLKCAACGCHRNFHRRDPDDPAPLHHHVPVPARRTHSPPSASRLLLSLSGGARSPSGPSDHEMNQAAAGGVVVYYNNNNGQNGNCNSKKRFRTKFSQEQKEKMYKFSEKIGWKLRKGEERLVEEFCKGIGVERGVFKVWMHNNKHSSSSSSSVVAFSNNNNNNNNGKVTGNCATTVAEFHTNGGQPQQGDLNI